MVYVPGAMFSKEYEPSISEVTPFSVPFINTFAKARGSLLYSTSISFPAIELPCATTMVPDKRQKIIINNLIYFVFFICSKEPILMLRFGYLRITLRLTCGYFYKSEINSKSKMGVEDENKSQK